MTFLNLPLIRWEWPPSWRSRDRQHGGLFRSVRHLQPARRSAFHSRSLVEQSADRITDMIQRSTRYEMLRNDRDALYNVIQEVGSEPGIQRIRIFNKDGRIIFSTEANEIGTAVDKRAEACYRLPRAIAPLAKLNRRTARAVHRDKQGHRLLAVIRPIENAPNAPARLPSRRRPARAGGDRRHLSLAAVDAQIAHTGHLTWFLAGRR
jgi:hypothetical protein